MRRGPGRVLGEDDKRDYFVKKIDGQTMTFRWHSGYTMEQCRADVGQRTGLEPDSLRLIFAGKQLENGRTISDYW